MEGYPRYLLQHRLFILRLQIEILQFIFVVTGIRNVAGCVFQQLRKILLPALILLGFRVISRMIQLVLIRHRNDAGFQDQPFKRLRKKQRYFIRRQLLLANECIHI